MCEEPKTPTKLLCPFNPPEFEVSNDIYHPPKTYFPLQPTSNDYLLSAEDDETAGSSEIIAAEDHKLFQKLLQACSSSTKHYKLDTITEDIANRLDKSQGASPLMYACINGNIHMTTYLLENGAKVNVWDVNRKVTPLICAAAHGRLEIVKILIHNGCDLDAGLNSTDVGVHSALIWAIRRNHVNVVGCLLEHHARQRSTIAFAETPIHAAVTCGSPEILKMLLNAQGVHVKVDFQMGSGKSTPLHLAASGEHKNSLELCQILVEQGNAYINFQNVNERTPLHRAVISQNVQITKYLLSRFAKVNASDKFGRTPLYYAISDEPEALECINALIESGRCNINHQDKWGNSALSLAGAFGSEDIAEILLMNGADFSVKANCGSSALSILRKKIPKTDELLKNSFDQAVKLINSEDKSTGKSGQECTMEVDFKYILPSAPPARRRPFKKPVENRRKTSLLARLSTRLFRDMEEDKLKAAYTRKETSKIKCLLEEEYSSLLLHPVIHSFLELKWQKARCVLLPTLIFKMVLVILFSIYVQVPYVISEEEKLVNKSLNGTVSMENNAITGKAKKEEAPPHLFVAMYVVIVIMAVLKGLMGLIQILRAPKQQLKTLHPWIAWFVLYIMIFYMQPAHWNSVCSCEPFRRSMAALGICLAWLEVWLDMASRLPHRGLSIRVFMQVIKNFWYFILPHFCLLIGFLLAFTLLFPKHGEFQSFLFALAKIIRVMAGDITIVQSGSEYIDPEAPTDLILARGFAVYVYTAFIILVAIVLGNLLIGLVVNRLYQILWLL